MRTDMPTDVSGFADEGFGPVADTFAENFRRGTEMGAACAVHHDGRLVVDLHGGVADVTTGRPWTADTLTIGFSVSKGLMALCGYLAHQRGCSTSTRPSHRCGRSSPHMASRTS